MAQFDLLSWVSGGCKGGTYEGTSYLISARALHNRGLIRVEGRGPTWTAKITAEGRRLLKEQGRRVEAERERERREEEARAERERGRLALTADHSEREVTQITDCLARGSLLPDGQQFAHEPTRMDPILGVTAYLEPDFAALTPMRAFKDQQLGCDRVPGKARARLPSADTPCCPVPPRTGERRGRDGLVGPGEGPGRLCGPSEQGPDLSIKLPSREILVAIRELDERGRPGRAFITHTDYLTRTERTTVNKSFTASGKLEVTLTRGWEKHPVLSQRDTGKSTLEDRLPALIRVLEIGEAEADWARKEEERRPEIREERWQEVKKEAFIDVAYERNAKRSSLSSTAAMPRPPCAYADEIDAHAAELEDPDAQAAREWAKWIRQHAERTDPLSGRLRLVEVTSCSHEELQPHMRGWSTYGPYL